MDAAALAEAALAAAGLALGEDVASPAPPVAATAPPPPAPPPAPPVAATVPLVAAPAPPPPAPPPLGATAPAAPFVDATAAPAATVPPGAATAPPPPAPPPVAATAPPPPAPPAPAATAPAVVMPPVVAESAEPAVVAAPVVVAPPSAGMAPDASMEPATVAPPDVNMTAPASADGSVPTMPPEYVYAAAPDAQMYDMGAAGEAAPMAAEPLPPPPGPPPLPEPPKAPEPPKDTEEDAVADERPKIKDDAVVFLAKDTTINLLPSMSGSSGTLASVTDGGMQFLLAGARANVGIKSGRYMFEAKIIDANTSYEATGGRYGKGPMPPRPAQLLRLGFSTAGSTLLLGDTEESVCFDSDATFTHERKVTPLEQYARFARDMVIAVLLNLDETSPNGNTVSIFRDGYRVSQPQPLPECLKGKPLFPTLTFRNVTVQVNFGPTAISRMSFKCRMVGDAAEADVSMVTPPAATDSKHEVLVPVCLPDEGTFDWLDLFLEKNPEYVELSDRAILQWAEASGVYRPTRYTTKASNDRPEMSYQLPQMDAIRSKLRSVAPAQQRSFIVMEVKSNLIKEDRAELLKNFGSPNFKRIAQIMIGEPAKDFKEKVQSLLLKEKQQLADQEWKQKQEEAARQRAAERAAKEQERAKRKAEKEQKKALAAAKKVAAEAAEEAAKQAAAAAAAEKAAAEAAAAAEKGETPEEKKADAEMKDPEAKGDAPEATATAEKTAADAEKGEAPADKKDAEMKDAEVKAEAPKAAEPDPDEKDDESEEEEPEKMEDVVEEKPPAVELSEEEMKQWFRKHVTKDMTPVTFGTSFAKFTLPDEEEGFEEVRYEWCEKAKSAEYFKDWMMQRKLTTRMEELQPSEWFHQQWSTWQQQLTKWRQIQVDYKATIAKKAAEKEAAEKAAAAKAAAEKAAKEAEAAAAKAAAEAAAAAAAAAAKAAEEAAKMEVTEEGNGKAASEEAAEAPAAAAPAAAAEATAAEGGGDKMAVTEEGKAATEAVKMEPKEEPKEEAKVEPKEEPKVEPKEEPKEEPKIEPKEEPKVEPLVEAKVEPKEEPTDKMEIKEEVEENDGFDEDTFDVFGVKNVCDIGNGKPLFVDFSWEDWALLRLRYELYLLVHAFKKDVADPERVGIHVDNLLFYYSKYFRKTFTTKFYGVDTYEELLDFVQDTVSLNPKNSVLESHINDELDSVELFAKLTEECRRERLLLMDSGNEKAALKFNQAILTAPANSSGQYQSRNYQPYQRGPKGPEQGKGYGGYKGDYKGGYGPRDYYSGQQSYKGGDYKGGYGGSASYKGGDYKGSDYKGADYKGGGKSYSYKDGKSYKDGPPAGGSSAYGGQSYAAQKRPYDYGGQSYDSGKSQKGGSYYGREGYKGDYKGDSYKGGQSYKGEAPQGQSYRGDSYKGGQPQYGGSQQPYDRSQQYASSQPHYGGSGQSYGKQPYERKGGYERQPYERKGYGK